MFYFQCLLSLKVDYIDFWVGEVEHDGFLQIEHSKGINGVVVCLDEKSIAICIEMDNTVLTVFVLLHKNERVLVSYPIQSAACISVKSHQTRHYSSSFLLLIFLVPNGRYVSPHAAALNKIFLLLF